METVIKKIKTLFTQPDSLCIGVFVVDYNFRSEYFAPLGQFVVAV